MNLLVRNPIDVRKGIQIRKASLSFIMIVMGIMAFAAALQFRFGEGQVPDVDAGEAKARIVVCVIFSLVFLGIVTGLIAYSRMCIKLLEPKRLDGTRLVLGSSSKSLNLENCTVTPLFKTSAMWPLNTVTVLADEQHKAYISVDILEDASQVALLDRWAKVRGSLPLRAQEYQDKVTPR